MRKIRVLEMIDKPFLGGGQRTVLLLARNLDRRKFEISVASAPAGPLVEELRKAGVRYHPLKLEKTLSLRILGDIRRVLEENSVEILHTHGGVAGLYGRLAARKSRIKVIHTVHGLHYLHYRNPILRQAYIDLERRLGRSTDALVFVCRADLEKGKGLRLAPESKMHVIRNGVDLGLLKPGGEAKKLKMELGLQTARPLIGTVARLHRQKGLTYLIQAAPQIRSSFPGAKIVVVGGGPLRQELEQEAVRRGVGDVLLFLGERSNVPDLLNLFDVFVLPSLWEGLPYVLVEAAYLRKPIVATAVDGNPEVIEDGKTGLLIPPADPSALAATVILLVQDKTLAGRLAKAARFAIPPRFGLKKMIGETQQLYQDLVMNLIAGP
ncbi:MAG: glycosyltransferase family 4 protein [Candidatus Aminicenantales bacterium]